ncbi:MAG: DUF4230 domain-containing protein [Anaerolineae bacterium]|nr:DUF4230 domain-containing protein [Anaerolineae bacterium]
MTENNNNQSISINLSQTQILSVIIAAVILGGLGIFYWWITKPSQPEQITEDWPGEISPTFTPLASVTPFPTPSSTPTPTPLPPPKWGELGYLTSIEYTDQTVVEINRKRSVGGIINLTQDRILLMAVGEIQVGIDLTKIQDTDVTINGKNLHVVLPRATITSVELLPNQSKVFDQKQSLFFSQYEGIEIEALDKAKEQLTTQAEQNQNMIGLAEKIARLQLEEFLRQLDFEQIEITFKNKGL